MERDDERAEGQRIGEDRLSTLVAVALVVSNVVGGGILGVLKVLDVPPAFSGGVPPREVAAAWLGDDPKPAPAGVARVEVARPAPRLR